MNTLVFGPAGVSPLLSPALGPPRLGSGAGARDISKARSAPGISAARSVAANLRGGVKAAELGVAPPTHFSWARDSQLMDGASFCSCALPFLANSCAAWPAAPPSPALPSRPYPICVWTLGREHRSGRALAHLAAAKTTRKGQNRGGKYPLPALTPWRRRRTFLRPVPAGAARVIPPGRGRLSLPKESRWGIAARLRVPGVSGPEKVGSQPRGADETGPTSTKRKGDHPAAQPGKPSPLGASLFSPATCEFPAHSAASPSPERREAEESRSRTGGASRLRPR
ncbi:hypothetical protein R6Z07F_014318 [Ovis aries]